MHYDAKLATAANNLKNSRVRDNLLPVEMRQSLLKDPDVFASRLQDPEDPSNHMQTLTREFVTRNKKIDDIEAQMEKIIYKSYESEAMKQSVEEMNSRCDAYARVPLVHRRSCSTSRRGVDWSKRRTCDSKQKTGSSRTSRTSARKPSKKRSRSTRS